MKNREPEIRTQKQDHQKNLRAFNLPSNLLSSSISPGWTLLDQHVIWGQPRSQFPLQLNPLLQVIVTSYVPRKQRNCMCHSGKTWHCRAFVRGPGSYWPARSRQSRPETRGFEIGRSPVWSFSKCLPPARFGHTTINNNRGDFPIFGVNFWEMGCIRTVSLPSKSTCLVRFQKTTGCAGLIRVLYCGTKNQT